MDFRDQFRDLQEIVRELTKIRDHNLKFKEGDPQADLLLFAEASLCLLSLERFLRILPDLHATEQETLWNLLDRATSRKLGLLHFVNLDTGELILDESQRQRCLREITSVRNTLQHGNYEQAARQANLGSVAEYFKKQFASEIETVFQITDRLVAQIDPNTGRRR